MEKLTEEEMLAQQEVLRIQSALAEQARKKSPRSIHPKVREIRNTLKE